MTNPVLGVVAGLLTGAVTVPVVVQTLARSTALTMPRGMNMLLWDSVVVLGLGATLVALALQLVLQGVLRGSWLAAFSSIAGAALTMVWMGLLPLAATTLLAVAIGMLLAPLLNRRRRRG